MLLHLQSLSDHSRSWEKMPLLLIFSYSVMINPRELWNLDEPKIPKNREFEPLILQYSIESLLVKRLMN